VSSSRSDGVTRPESLAGLPEQLQPGTRVESDERWAQYRPGHAPHVVGVFSVRRFEDGAPVTQIWKVLCERCGATFRGRCSSGAVKAHIARFGGVHAACAGDVMARRRGG